MIIKELYISEFGAIKDRKIEFSNDSNLNIIYGENESGKTTVFLFIKFIFYGIPRKTQTNTERERSLSWASGVAAGSMIFEHNGREYRIERSFSDRSRGEKVVITDLDRGMPLQTDKTPGEYFLGVPREVFESSACVGQMASSTINGDKTAQSLSNMLSVADESVDTAAILKDLNNIRASYLHKNQAGGSIYEDENKIKSYKIKLEDAKIANLTIDGKTESFEKIKAEYDALKLELETKDALVTQFNKIGVLRRFEALREKEAQIPEVCAKKEDFIKENLKTDFFPTRNHVAELAIASKELDRAKVRLNEKEDEKNSLVVGFDSDAAELGSIIEENDGIEKMLSPNKKMREKAAFFRNLGIASIAAMVVLSIGSAAGFFAVGLVCCLVIAAVAMCTLGVALTFFIKSAKTNKMADKELEALAASFGASSDMIETRMEFCLSELEKKREHMAKNAKLEAELEVAQETYETVVAYVYKLLTQTLENDPEPTCEVIDEEIGRLEIFIDSYDELVREEDTFLRMIENEKNALARYDEEKIRSEITVDIDSATPEAVEEAERTKSFLVAKKTAYEGRITLLQNELIALRIKATDPLHIADKLAQLEEKVKKDREFYDALVLAMNTIEDASVSMRGNVTPIIGKTASELMGRISDNKYKTLRTTPKLGVSLDKDGYGVGAEFLSGGTKDAAYLSLRLALIMKIYENEYPPVVFDESFCQLDNTRLEKMMGLLDSLANEGMQILLFTSHLREQEMCDVGGYKYSLIKM